MMRSRSQLVFAVALGASAFLMACADADSDDADQDAEDGATAAGGGEGGAGGGSGLPGEGGAAGGSGIVEGAPESCEELGGRAPDPDYPGFDHTWLGGSTAPEGCVAGAEPGKTWTLRLADGETTVRLSFADDVVHANGVECTSANDEPAQITAETRLRVVGSGQAELVILDLADGTPSALGWTASTGLVLELGGGEDRLVIRGGADADAITLSTTDNNTSIDIDGDRAPDALANGLTAIVLALGPGDDRAEGQGPGQPLTVPIAICGGAGNDQLRGGTAIDRLEGGDGDDVLIAGASDDGADLASGGDGFDCADYGARSADLRLSLDDDADDGADDEGDNVLADVEWLVSGAGADQLRGSSAANRIEGGSGDDTIEGGMGTDVLFGADGDDTFLSGSEGDGADFVEGGAGADTISYAGRVQGVSVSLCMTDPAAESCTPEVCSCAADDGAVGEGDRVADIEIVHGTEAADSLIGTAGDDVFYGYGGDDHIEGLEGNDSMYGDEGDDTLWGESGDDFLDGAIGDDIFEAGLGDGDICIVEGGEAATECELY